jgi:hypothetical protein
LWLRSDIGVTPNTNGAAVSAWTDQSGNGNSFAQGTAVNRPIFTNNVVNGRPILRFTAANNHFITVAGAGLNSTSALPFSFFAVTNSNATQTNPRGLFDSAEGVANAFRFFDNNQVEYNNNTPEVNYTLNASAPTIVGILGTFSGTTRTLTAFRDALEIGTALGNTTAVPFTTPRFGRTNTNRNFDGDLGDAIIFNGTPLNAAQRLVVENHLGAKFGRDLGANDYYKDPITVGSAGFNYDVIGIMGLNTGEKQSSSSTPDGAVNLAEYLTTGLNTAGSPAVTFIGHKIRL